MCGAVALVMAKYPHVSQSALVKVVAAMGVEPTLYTLKAWSPRPLEDAALKLKSRVTF